MESVSRIFGQLIERKQIAGAVSLVARGGELIHLDAIGVSDLESGRPLQIDDLFWVASMTKPISAAAALLLMEEGKVSLDDPIGQYLAEFAEQCEVTDHVDQQAHARPVCPITLRDLLRHTHGLAEVPPQPADTSLAEHVRTIARDPHQFEPGSRWQYGDSGMNIAGRIVEVISGESFQDFLQTRFFEPLGMKDTTFFPNVTQKDRIARMYGPNADRSGLVEMERVLLPGDICSPKRTVFPSGGLFSTAMDLLRFYQMLANSGTHDGRRYLSGGAVHDMTHSQIGDLETAFEGGKYGLGLHVIEKPAGEFAMVSPGTWGHDGSSGTSAFYDPQRKLLMIHMIQRTGLWDSRREGHAIRKAFQEAVIREQSD